jgi:NADH:ubiquinone oxidoreductase subunit K
MNLLNYKINILIGWLNFWNAFFWISLFGFVINIENFLKILIFSEVTWLSLYCYTILTGVSNNDLTLLSNSFFILGFASLEFSIGLLLIIIFKNNMKSINLTDDAINDKTEVFSTKKNYINRFSWRNV